jgi:PAS domain S-box-containing protein
MTDTTRSPKELLAENENLRLRLEEAEDTLRAIGCGEVDAFVVSGPDGEQVFTLAGAEHPYRVLVETMNEGAATLAADGTILYCNNRLAAMLQVPLERLVGTQLGSYVTPADLYLFEARLGKCTQLCDKDEVAMLTGSGISVPVLISCCALEISGSRAINVVVTDLTQQKRNEEIMAAEMLARSIIEQVGEAIIVCDNGGMVIRASRAAHQLCGENPLLKPFDELFRLRIPETENFFSVSPPLHDGCFGDAEVEFKRSDGRLFHLILKVTPLESVQTGIIGCVVTLTDITERRQAELERNWVMEYSLDMLCLVGFDGYFKRVSPSFERILGWSEAELLAKPFIDFIHPDDLEMTLQMADDHVRGTQAIHFENRYLCKDGSFKWLSWNSQPMVKEKLIIGVARDITENKRADEELKNLNDELEIRVEERTTELRLKDQLLILQSRQAVMGETINYVAHQWRQPLNSLSLIVQLLRDSYHDGECSGKYMDETVDQIINLIKYMSQTINDFRNFSMPDRELKTFNLEETVNKTLSLVGDSFKANNIQINIKTEDGPMVTGYQNEYCQVLLNILNNATDALLGNNVSAPRIEIKLSREGQRSVTTISDNAGGIPEIIIDKIFEPYFTTKVATEGTGIGLYMSKTIIEKRMKGEISVRNTRDGAEFRIEV